MDRKGQTRNGTGTPKKTIRTSRQKWMTPLGDNEGITVSKTGKQRRKKSAKMTQLPNKIRKMAPKV